MSTEQWQHGDVVLAADGELWRRAAEQGWTWAYVWSQEGSVEEDHPQRPLTLLVRDGLPARVCTRCGDGDLYPRRCSQCGGRWVDWACGPTHALITSELGLEGLST